jgi:hypothetical protein
MEPFVDVYHKSMEMDAAFTFQGRWEGLVEEVHKHRFTGSDIAIKVETFRGVLWRGCGYRCVAAEYPRKLDQVMSLQFTFSGK